MNEDANAGLDEIDLPQRIAVDDMRQSLMTSVMKTIAPSAPISPGERVSRL
jgi:hypothetical protein